MGAEDVTVIGSIAAEVVAMAVVRAITEAEALAGVPAAKDVRHGSRGKA
jgi:L-aminopeptidase/D-esterase-like protein